MNDRVKTNFAQRHDQLAERLQERFAAKGCQVICAHGEVTLVLPREQLAAIAGELRDGEDFRFDELIDVCGVDYAAYGHAEWTTTEASATGFGRGVSGITDLEAEEERRFAAVYHLLSVEKNQRLRLRVFVDTGQPIIDSVVDIWPSANWFEREAFDLYGILFSGHPDLRRILTDYGFVGHPFRKDFPLEGHVEMRYDPQQRRVIYEPVKLDPRVLVPKVIREDNRFLGEETAKQDPTDA